MKKLNFFALFFISMLLQSCIYQFAGKYSSLPSGIKTVYVDSIKNTTYEPNLQVNLKRALINELNLDPRVKVVDKNKASGIVKVVISNYNISPSAFGKSGFASMYRCVITVDVSLIKNGQYIIKHSKLSAYKDYSSSDLIAATENARSSASKDVIKDLASKIKDKLFIDF
jgi:outer membrane lipopolysaccharide assembly protein LptE/RlpB